MDPNKQLAQFISFHLHPHSTSYNAIEGVIYSTAIGNQVKDLLELLNKDFIDLNYDENTDAENFLTDLAQNLSKGKIVCLYVNTPKFDPIVFDQLTKLKDTNSFDIQVMSQDLSTLKIPGNAKIFMFSINDHSQVAEIADHLLDLRKVN